MEKMKSQKLFLVYFFIIAIILFSFFFWLNRNDLVMMYIDIGADTYSEYWPQFEAAKRWWEEFPGSLWNFSHGLGNSFATYTTALFNPFAAVMSFFDQTLDGINYMILLEYVCLSIFAYGLYHEMGLRDGVLIIAALSHTLCGFMVGWGQHYSFGAMFVIFTAMQYGFERYQQRGKWGLISVCVAAIGSMSAYFLYMILLFSAIWWSVRFFATAKKKNIIQFFLFGIRLCGVVAFGVVMCLPVLGEQLKLLLNTPRVSGNLNVFNFQLADTNVLTTTIYRSLSNVLMGINEMPFGLNFYEAPILYTGVISWFGIIGYTLYWCKRKSGKGLVYLCIISLIVLFPNFISVMFNGFSTSTTRWYFLLVPIQCYLTAKGIQHILIDRNTRIWTMCVTAALLLYVGFNYLVNIYPVFVTDATKQLTALKVVGVVSIVFVIAFSVGSEKRTKAVCAIIIMTIVCEMSVNVFLTNDRRMLRKSDLLTPGYWASTGFYDGTREAVDRIDEEETEFYRIAKNYNQIDLMAALHQDYSGETFYYSAISKNTSDLVKTFGLRIPESNYFFGFDGKQELRNLYGAKYILSKSPLNYSNHIFMDNVNGVYIYENTDSVGLTAFFTETIGATQYRLLDMSEKNALLYEACVVDDCFETAVDETTVGEHVHTLSQPLDCITTKKESAIDLVVVTPVEGSIEVLLNNTTGIAGQLTITYSDDAEMSNGRSMNIWLPTGTQTVSIMEKNISNISITGSTVLIDSLETEVWQRNDDYVAAAAQTLRESAMRIESFSQEAICGTIDCQASGMLVFAINYSDGWHAIVDGKETDTICCNEAFVGIKLDEGTHSIELSYQPEFFMIGVVASISAHVLLLLCSIITACWRRGSRKTVK